MGTLVCRIELDKTTGAKVTIENADGKITQTIHMDGTKITTKVAGEQNTSTIEQVADAITITVKNFTLAKQQIVEHESYKTNRAEHHELMPAVWHAAKIKNPGQAEQVVGGKTEAKGERGRDNVVQTDMLGQVVQASKVNGKA